MGENVGPTQQDVDELARKLRAQELSASAVMNQLVSWMRKHPQLLGARELYQEASKAAFSQRSSTLSHSHPPPLDDDE